MIEIEPVTLSEAQFLTGRPEKEINAAIDRGEIEKITEKVRVEVASKKKPRRRVGRGPARKRRASRTFGYAPPATRETVVRKVGGPELLFLTLARDLQADLTPAGRRKLYQAIKTQGTEPGAIALGPFKADVTRTVKALTARFKHLRSVRHGIVEQPGRDPVIKGTEISAYRVAALAKDQTVDEILADYPGLTEQKVKRAIDFASAYPKPGRPYPTRSLKRAAEALGDLGVFEFGREETEKAGAKR
jgi:uncharacterized protein (DUF433 family)